MLEHINVSVPPFPEMAERIEHRLIWGDAHETGEKEEAEVCDLCDGEGKVERQVLVSGDGAPSYREGDGTFYPCPECSPVEPADDRDDQLPDADA